MKQATIHARVPVELKRRYDAEVARTGMDMSTLVRLALVRFLPTDEARVLVTVEEPVNVNVEVVP